MKTSYRQTFSKSMFACFFSIALASPVKAQGIEIELLKEIRDYTKATANYVNTLLSDIQAAGKELLEALTAPTPAIDDTTKANTQIAPAISKAAEYRTPLMDKALMTIMSTTASEQPTILAESTNLPGPDFPLYSTFRIAPNMQMNLPGGRTGPSPYSLDSLLDEIAFSEGSKENNCQSKPEPPSSASSQKPLCQSFAAQSFISYLSALANPPLIPDFKKLAPPIYSQTQISQFRSSTKVQNYLTALRSYTAAQSVSLSNLYHLYAERVIQEGLGKTLNVHKYSTVDEAGKVVPGEVIPDVSPLQAEEYLAKRRVYDPGWYKEMESTTSPFTLARETLYVLAEIRLELFKNRMETERLLATLSSMQLVALKPEKALLDQQASTIEMPKGARATQ